MNGDHDLEAALRRYRPAAQTSELRARVLTPATQARRTWPWAVAAAALLAIAVGFSAAGGRVAPAPADESGAALARVTDPAALDALEQVYGSGLSVVMAYTTVLAAAEPAPSVAPAVEVEPWR
ncbi:MAG: hypothetical protein ABI211_18135 [Vicinamibacterales bacterium]